MKIYWTKKRLPKASDANDEGMVLATNSGRQGMAAVPYQHVSAQKYAEWAPLYGPVESTGESDEPKHV